MRSGLVGDVEHLSCMPNQDGNHPILLVKTNLPAGEMNSFYMDLADLDKIPLKIAFMTSNTDRAKDPEAITIGDSIVFDKQDGLHRVVVWNNRRIRQRGYSFDNYAQRVQ